MVATVPVGAFPVGVAITPNGAFAYVANDYANNVSVIDTATNAVVATVPVGNGPAGVAITPVADDDSGFAQLNGGNTFTGNQLINGNVTATNILGMGAGLTNLSPANIASGTANINISGTAASAFSAGNASNLGGLAATNYARLDIGNSFNGNQSVAGNVSASGNLNSGGSATIGGGTPIVEHLSQVFPITVPSISPKNCAPIKTIAFTGAADGDTIALGIKNALNPGGALVYFAWVSAANTVSIKICDPFGPSNPVISDSIRVDLWKH